MRTGSRIIGKSWAKHNQLFEKHNGRFEKDNEQFEKRNRLLGHEKPSLRCNTVSRGPFATVQTAISNRLREKWNREKRKKARVGTPAFAPIII
jgi:hypothetical protein